ncbi:unnamed protein product, partial [marine sediment metagenome]
MLDPTEFIHDKFRSETRPKEFEWSPICKGSARLAEPGQEPIPTAENLSPQRDRLRNLQQRANSGL